MRYLGTKTLNDSGFKSVAFLRLKGLLFILYNIRHPHAQSIVAVVMTLYDTPQPL